MPTTSHPEPAPAAPTTPGGPISRRRLLSLMGAGAGALALAACGGGSGSGTSTSGTTTATTGSTGTTGSTTTTAAAAASSSTAAATGAALASIPDETAGPFPGNGTNGPNILTMDGVVRSDLRSSLGSGGTTAQGVPLTIELTVQDGATPLEGVAVYAWHCDAEGGYSMYGQVADESYLRGVQVADDRGHVTFTTIFPAAYDGRWPHVHFQVFPSLAAATGGGRPTKTSQLALPEDVCDAVYEQGGYDDSLRNLERTSLEQDMVFHDGWDLQLATVTGDVTDGYTARLAFSV